MGEQQTSGGISDVGHEGGVTIKSPPYHIDFIPIEARLFKTPGSK